MPRTSTLKGSSFYQGGGSIGKAEVAEVIKPSIKIIGRKRSAISVEKIYTMHITITMRKKEKYDNDKITKTNSSRATIEKLSKGVKKTTKAFSTVHTNI